MKLTYLILSMVITVLSSTVFAQQKGTFTDPRDGKTYKTVQFGNQVWMAENLNVDQFRNGDLIAEVKSNSDWETAGKNGIPAWCYFENSGLNGNKWGRLYNWYAVADPRGLAPKGWHIPSDMEWSKMEEYIGISDAGVKLKSNTEWNGSNESNFNALHGGGRYEFGSFFELAKYATWWTSTNIDIHNAWGRILYYNENRIQKYNNIYDKNFKSVGMSVRCVQD